VDSGLGLATAEPPPMAILKVANVMSAYYNEIDPYAAQWLRKLIAGGHIADGVVDTRSIEDIHPIELREFTQCHFFAGIGVWSRALRLAGWPDSRRVWTGSCPCQPFSAAGKGDGFDDERHLWPAFNHLIDECRPPVVFGEQVASKDADPWIDLVQADLEALGYFFGAVPFPSASVGAPHIRDRLYWVADAGRSLGQRGSNTSGFDGDHTAQRGEGASDNQPRGSVGRLADTTGPGSQGSGYEWGSRPGWEGCTSERDGADGRVADAAAPGWGFIGRGGCAVQGDTGSHADIDHQGHRPGPTNGHWRAADWLLCRDGKWRPVEPGAFPLAHGATGRVGRLRAYGNAINAIQAQVFLEAWLDCQR